MKCYQLVSRMLINLYFGVKPVRLYEILPGTTLRDSTGGRMITPTRVFISSPGDHGLKPDQLIIKQGVLDRVRMVGFEPQEFSVSGDFSQISWNYDSVQYILGRCQGAIILGLIRWECWDEGHGYRFATDYNHYEGALALAKNLPTFILMHEHIYQGGIAFKGGGQYIVNLPDNADPTWLQSDPFMSKFNGWIELVKKRYHVFFGYSSKAKPTASKLRTFLKSKGVSVMDWAIDFKVAIPILGEIERASKLCLGGIFLFTKDDEIVVGDAKSAAPRDNVIFEAGYFMHAKGIEKTLIICEEGAKMPADIGGNIYLPLKDRNDISPIKNDLVNFIANNL
jgi:hypothetical protein